LEFERTEWQVGELLAALEECGMPTIITMPNADTGGRIVKRMIEEFVQTHRSAQMADNLGTQGYFSMMFIASAMVGNSSSGIIEAASFKLPVVNVGTRQLGRLRAANVIDVGYNREDIVEGIRKATQSEFRESLHGLVNPYDRGQASDMIVECLKTIALDDRLVIKHFRDVPTSITEEFV
jgi:UDP-N-acetylglucosamine 2-epimerase (non-hydrolysing)/GDP/UDP-N,N'-diacetylbacillosamine 2-epimerase (hydrolysing)